MRRITLITGGVSSGKSRHALARAAAHGPKVLFVATCVPRDDEMRAKVARHRAERPASWTTVEASRDLSKALRPGFDATVVDCLTLLVSQMMVEGVEEAEIQGELDRLCAAASGPLYLVTNEVGSGVVPEHPLGRRFREVAGRANQRAAAAADEVVLMVSGIPVTLKGETWKS